MGSHAETAAALLHNGSSKRATRADLRDVLQGMTTNERIVYEELQKSSSPKKAYALLEALRDDGIRAPMSIYRALDALIDKGLAKKITSLNAFAAINPEDRSKVSAFFTCRRCGKTQEVKLDRSVIKKILPPTVASLSEVFLEAYGDCNNDKCRNDIHSAPK